MECLHFSKDPESAAAVGKTAAAGKGLRKQTEVAMTLSNNTQDKKGGLASKVTTHLQIGATTLYYYPFSEILIPS